MTRGYSVKDGQVANASFLSMTQPHAAGALHHRLDDHRRQFVGVVCQLILERRTVGRVVFGRNLRREDLLGHALPACPSAFDYKTVAEHGSMFNTPPTYAIYIAGLVFKWIKAQGGLAAMEAHNRTKAAVLYDYLDSQDFFSAPVDKDCRSLMNVPFRLRDATLDGAFLEGAPGSGHGRSQRPRPANR